MHGTESKTSAQPTPAAEAEQKSAQLPNELMKLLEFGRFYALLRMKRVKASAHKVFWTGVLLCAVAFSGAVAVVASVCMLLWSAASGLSDLASLPPWGGRMIVSIAVLLGGGGALAMMMYSARARLLRVIALDYEARKQNQQRVFGEDVEHAARKPT